MTAAEERCAISGISDALDSLQPISDAIFNQGAGSKKADREDMARQINWACVRLNTALLAFGVKRKENVHGR